MRPAGGVGGGHLRSQVAHAVQHEGADQHSGARIPATLLQMPITAIPLRRAVDRAEDADVSSPRSAGSLGPRRITKIPATARIRAWW